MLRWVVAIAILVILLAAVAGQASDIATDARRPSSFRVKPDIILPTPVPEGATPEAVDEAAPPLEDDTGDGPRRQPEPMPPDSP